MLKRLYIENIAVIEKTSIELGGAFTVLTGETGAGKSIIIDSINMVLGERTTRDIVRTGAKSAYVSAEFEVTDKSVIGELAKLDLFPEENGLLILSRELTADGKSSCKINSRPQSASLLKDIGKLLVNIHGQHDAQDLLNPDKHIIYLDNYAGNYMQLHDYTEKYNKVIELRKEIKSLSTSEQERERRVDLLKYQIEEIEMAQLSENEEEALADRKNIIVNYEKIAQAVNEAYDALSSDNGAVNLISAAAKSLSHAAKFSTDIEALSEKLMDLQYLLQDYIKEINELSDDSEYNPDELAEIELRIDLIYKLKKKYGSSIDEIFTYYDKIKIELEKIEFYEVKLAELQKQLEISEQNLKVSAEKLTKARIDASKVLTDKVSEELSQLDMLSVVFKINIELQDYSENGADNVEFLISANPGELPRPLVKIASGGELSRIMLALKSILTGDNVTTLIFDEIDTGISGSSASKVAEKIKKVAKDRQVLCVTHLSQIAAAADNHLLIKKDVAGGRTYTAVQELDFKGRVGEIARIISGDKITELSLRNAEEMLLLHSGGRK